MGATVLLYTSREQHEPINPKWVSSSNLLTFIKKKRKINILSLFVCLSTTCGHCHSSLSPLPLTATPSLSSCHWNLPAWAHCNFSYFCCFCCCCRVIVPGVLLLHLLLEVEMSKYNQVRLLANGWQLAWQRGVKCRILVLIAGLSADETRRDETR